MGFNKRYLSKNNIKIIANNRNYIDFYNYFMKADVIISEDNFSSGIYDKISRCSINDKNKIINLGGKKYPM